MTENMKMMVRKTPLFASLTEQEMHALATRVSKRRPPITQLVSRKVCRMCSRSASASVLTSGGAFLPTRFSQASGGWWSTVPTDRTTQRSMMFCSFRTLPGH